MSEVKEVCEVCGKSNSEVKVVEMKKPSLWRVLTGTTKLKICQSCISKLFRGLNPCK